MSRVIRGDGEPRVVPGEVFDARQEADRIVGEAREEGHRIVGEARREAERLRAIAQQEGREQGRAEVAALVLRLTRARAGVLASAERDVARVALAAAKRIVGEEIALDPARIRTTVQDVLERARRARHAVLRVHPDDAEEARRLVGESPGEGVHVDIDPSLERGGCVLESDVGELDARLETQLSALERALLGDETP